MSATAPPRPEIDWYLAPPDATHVLAKYPTSLIWMKLGADDEPCLVWSFIFNRWKISANGNSGERRKSKFVYARPAPAETWSVTDDSENFSYDTLGELLAENSGPDRVFDDIDLTVGSSVYRAEKAYPDPSTFIDAERVRAEIEQHMSDNAKANGFAEVCDDYPKVSEQAEAELAAFLKHWSRKHCQPTFFNIVKCREHVITAQDLEDAQ